MCHQQFDPAAAVPSRPFCSAACKLQDLMHWLKADYVISEPLETTFEIDES